MDVLAELNNDLFVEYYVYTVCESRVIYVLDLMCKNYIEFMKNDENTKKERNLFIYT